MLSSVGKHLHSSADLVWGYTQCKLTDRASRVLACVTKSGITFPLTAPFGPGNLPSIFQNRNQERLGPIQDPQSSTPEARVVRVAIDDFKISSKDYPEHIRQLKLMLERAREDGAEFKLLKCNFCGKEIEFWGFVLDSQGRRPSPSKLEQLANWPDYAGLDDLRSHVHFAEYLKEYAPELPDVIKPLRKYLKKGARFEDYVVDADARAAKDALTKLILDKCTIVNPDFEAAGQPFDSGRPFEIFSDVSEYGWCVILTQRPVKGGTPKIIAVCVRSFTEAQIKWSAFERDRSSFFCGAPNDIIPLIMKRGGADGRPRRLLSWSSVDDDRLPNLA